MTEDEKTLPFRAHRDMIIRMSHQFSDHKKGLPEWLKNSNDSYYRFEESGTNCSDRPIILAFTKNEVLCLDFGGADGQIIKELGLNYGDPTAAKQGINGNLKIEGGHGNGGKYYGIAQFNQCFLMMYHKAKFSKFKITKEHEYELVLNETMPPGAAFNKLEIGNWEFWKSYPLFKEKIMEGEWGFFCWKGINPIDKAKLTDKRKFMNLINALSYNKQAFNTIRERDVMIIYNGQLFYPKLDVPTLEIDEKYAQGWSFNLPNELKGYQFNKQDQSILSIQVSKQPLTADRSDLNCLEIGIGNSIVASYDIPKLTGNKGIAKSLYGTISCQELKEYGCIDNDRIHLIDNELSNEFIQWCTKNIFNVIQEIEEREKKETDKKEFKKISNFLNEIMDAVSDILEEEDLIKLQKSSKGPEKTKTDVPTDENGGYGRDGHKIKNKGGGIRKGRLTEGESMSIPKKGRNRIQILLSEIDEDPLNPGQHFILTPRHSLLVQRKNDVEHGIWWLNTQKSYLDNFKTRNARTTPFYLFIIKEVVFSHRSRRDFKAKSFDPDEVETMNFDLIDTIFSKVSGKLDLNMVSTEDNLSQEIFEFIIKQEDFYVTSLAEKFEVQINFIHNILLAKEQIISSLFTLEKDNGLNHYIRKI